MSGCVELNRMSIQASRAHHEQVLILQCTMALTRVDEMYTELISERHPFKGELNPKIKFVLFERTLKITASVSYLSVFDSLASFLRYFSDIEITHITYICAIDVQLSDMSLHVCVICISKKLKYLKNEARESKTEG